MKVVFRTGEIQVFYFFTKISFQKKFERDFEDSFVSSIFFAKLRTNLKLTKYFSFNRYSNFNLNHKVSSMLKAPVTFLSLFILKLIKLNGEFTEKLRDRNSRRLIPPCQLCKNWAWLKFSSHSKRAYIITLPCRKRENLYARFTHVNKTSFLDRNAVRIDRCRSFFSFLSSMKAQFFSTYNSFFFFSKIRSRLKLNSFV